MVAFKQTKLSEFAQDNLWGDEAKTQTFLERASESKAEPISAPSGEAREDRKFTSPMSVCAKTVVSPPSFSRITTPQAELGANITGSEKVVKSSEKITTTHNVEVSPGNRNNTSTRTRSARTIMRGHHILYSARYSGSQPFDSEARIKPIGRGNWAKHVWERQNYKIIVGTKTIEITLEHDGSLDSVKEKLDYCQETAERIGRVFVERHNLTLLSPFTLSGHSHWVVEHQKTSDMLKPICDMPKNERVGAIYGDSSHPELTELIGKDSAVGAVGMDTLLIDLPNLITSWQQGQVRYQQDVKVLLGAIGQVMAQNTEILREFRKKEV